MKNRGKCYPTGNNRIFEIVGYTLLALGVIMLFACIPGWAWVALLGIGLIVIGYILLKLSQSWR